MADPVIKNMPIKRFATAAEGSVGPQTFHHIPRVMFGMPTTGIVRFEWAMQMAQLIVPVNWSQSMTAHHLPLYGPMGQAVAAARNSVVAEAIKKGFEWIFFIDTDTIPPPDILLRLNEYTREKKYPIVSGLYYAKGWPSYPLVFRGRGNGVYLDWKRGDKVWVDGVPMGCTLINMKIFEHLPQVDLTDGTGGRGWYDTPRFAAVDPETGDFHREVGTEDLDLCDRIIHNDVLTKAGWPELADKEFPFLCDTGMWFTHISSTGECFPSIVPKVGESPKKYLEEVEF